MSDEEAKIMDIANYVLEQSDPDRLKMAVAIYESFDEIRCRVIRNFSEQLVGSLGTAPPGWQVDASDLQRDPRRRFTRLEIRHKDWEDGLTVNISPQYTGPNGWIIGVSKRVPYANRDLRDHLNNECGQGKRSDYYPWYRWFRDEFGQWNDWTKGETLIALREGMNGECGQRICERIIKIAGVVDGFFPR